MFGDQLFDVQCCSVFDVRIRIRNLYTAVLCVGYQHNLWLILFSECQGCGAGGISHSFDVMN